MSMVQERESGGQDVDSDVGVVGPLLIHTLEVSEFGDSVLYKEEGIVIMKII